jgi:hypothetical protein
MVTCEFLVAQMTESVEVGCEWVVLVVRRMMVGGLPT